LVLCSLAFFVTFVRATIKKTMSWNSPFVVVNPHLPTFARLDFGIVVKVAKDAFQFEIAKSVIWSLFQCLPLLSPPLSSNRSRTAYAIPTATHPSIRDSEPYLRWRLWKPKMLSKSSRQVQSSFYLFISCWYFWISCSFCWPLCFIETWTRLLSWPNEKNICSANSWVSTQGHLWGPYGAPWGKGTHVISIPQCLCLKHPRNLLQAAEAMGAISDPSSIPILKEFLTDPSRSVRETCEIAISKIDWDNSEEGRQHHTRLSDKSSLPEFVSFRLFQLSFLMSPVDLPLSTQPPPHLACFAALTKPKIYLNNP